MQIDGDVPKGTDSKEQGLQQVQQAIERSQNVAQIPVMLCSLSYLAVVCADHFELLQCTAAT